jgi:hypothetical protein
MAPRKDNNRPSGRKRKYKELLINAVKDAGIEPLLGGLEYAEDLAKQMNLGRAANADQLLNTCPHWA